MGYTKEGKVIGKYEKFFLSLSITLLPVPCRRAFFYFRNGNKYDLSHWGVY